MPQRFYSATIQNAWDTLHKPFSDGHKHEIPMAPDGGFGPCTITGRQAGCISSLLWKACKLDDQVARQRRVIKKLRSRLRETQKMIDCSIARLDPDQ